MLLAPLLWPQVLPQLQSYVTLAAPEPPPAPRAPTTTVQPRSVVHQIARQWQPDVFYAPQSIPAAPAQIEDPPDVGPPGVPGSIGPVGRSGNGTGVVGSILSGIPTVVVPPKAVEHTPPPKEAAPTGPQRYTIGGLVKAPTPLRRPDPIYPPMARTAHIEGVVQLEGVIGTDGRIHELRVLSGHPFLVKAATDAVQQWLYRPGTLNGNLVEVIAPITVTFRLGGQ